MNARVDLSAALPTFPVLPDDDHISGQGSAALAVCPYNKFIDIVCFLSVALARGGELATQRVKASVNALVIPRPGWAQMGRCSGAMGTSWSVGFEDGTEPVSPLPAASDGAGEEPTQPLSPSTSVFSFLRTS